MSETLGLEITPRNPLKEHGMLIFLGVAVILALSLGIAFYTAGGGIPSFNSLTSQLKNGSAPARVRAAQLIGQSTTEKAEAELVAPALGDALFDVSLDVQIAASEALRRIGPIASKAVPQLVEALNRSVAERREYVEKRKLLDEQASYDFDVEHKVWLEKMAILQVSLVRSLGAMGDDAVLAVPNMITVLSEGNTQSIIAALVGLGGLGLKAKEARSAIMPLLDSKEPEIKRYAVWAIGSLRSLNAIPKLEKLLDDPNGAVRRNAVKSLKALNTKQTADIIDQKTNQLMRVLKSPDLSKRQSAATRLREINTPKALKALGESSRLGT